ncbi:collagen alpha-1(I) chain-like [Oxyura jamaicensis]|uniref:collagen alpha-1(I) chain-like n=1 Tax=Oxyura jamaicensis TaxID=8884 RepID=UPI0015A5A1AB|nr:collagen alpha-1(I) chain-like [Oxyura jamaicensis]
MCNGGGLAPALASLRFKVQTPGACRGRRMSLFCVGAEHQGLRGQTGPRMGARERCWVGAQPALPTGPPACGVAQRRGCPGTTQLRLGPAPSPRLQFSPFLRGFSRQQGSKAPPPPPRPLLGTDSCLSPGSLLRLGGSACRGRPGRSAGCLSPGCRRGPGQPPRGGSHGTPLAHAPGDVGVAPAVPRGQGRKDSDGFVSHVSSSRSLPGVLAQRHRDGARGCAGGVRSGLWGTRLSSPWRGLGHPLGLFWDKVVVPWPSRRWGCAERRGADGAWGSRDRQVGPTVVVVQGGRGEEGAVAWGCNPSNARHFPGAAARASPRPPARQECSTEPSCGAVPAGAAAAAPRDVPRAPAGMPSSRSLSLGAPAPSSPSFLLLLCTPWTSLGSPGCRRCLCSSLFGCCEPLAGACRPLSAPSRHRPVPRGGRAEEGRKGLGGGRGGSGEGRMLPGVMEEEGGG